MAAIDESAGLAGLPVTDSAPHERGDAARNRALLLDAARALIAEHGADAVTMDDVASAAGVGKGTLFRRFGSRAGLMIVLAYILPFIVVAGNVVMPLAIAFGWVPDFSR